MNVFDSTGVADTSMFAPLNLPRGTEFRSGSGAPGPRYWEQRADYDLHGTLDTAAKTLRGEMTLRYTNHSPDTLRYIFFQVEQNAFQDKSLNSFVFPAASRFGARNFEGGDVIERFNQKSGIFTLTRMSNDDCMYLDRKSRLCTIYDKRPDTCRNHPKVGPRPGYCAYKPKVVGR